MALIKCSDCGRQISDQAPVCPGCGKTINTANNSIKYEKKSDKQHTGIIILILILGVACFIYYLYNRTSYDNSRSTYTYSGNSTTNSSYSYTPKTGKEGALAKAKSYLNSQAFSYEGLIEQLEYHGFSESEAKYAADNCGADWKKQALKKAKSYIRSQAFSYDGLVEQLEYSGFTSSEATAIVYTILCLT